MATRPLDFDGLAKALNQGSKDLNKNLRVETRAAGQLVADGARILAAEHSGKIAPTIRVSVVRGYTVRITALGPLAAMYEAGNRGAGGAGRVQTTFNHPVFAKGPRNTWTWLPKDKRQRRWPFMLPAFLARRAAVLAQMNKAIHDSFPGNA